MFFLLSCFVKNSELNANSEDPDQTPRSAASDLGLLCLPMSFYGTSGLNGLINIFGKKNKISKLLASVTGKVCIKVKKNIDKVGAVIKYCKKGMPPKEIQ